MTLKARNDIHLARRVWHFVGVMFILFLYRTVPPKHTVVTTIAICAVVVCIDLGRRYFPRLNSILMKAFSPFMREYERTQMTGMSYMLLGVSVVILFFSKPVVELTLLFLGVADPMASYFGIRFGKDKLIGGKSLQGSLAAFVTCFLLSFGYLYTMDFMHERMFIVCLLGGLIGAFSELIPIGRLDDNFVFPLLSAVLLTGMFSLFGGL